ncbi:MAG: FkbM family methyltransferase [Planctomycetota bacterium]
MMKSGIKGSIARLIDRFDRKLAINPLAKLLQKENIDCILDVGANKGQYGLQVRGKGYTGRIESFEPLSQAFGVLRERSSNDPEWNIHQLALGNEQSTKEINISSNQPSSSFRDLDPNFKSSQVDLTFVGKESVKIDQLDNVFESVSGSASNVYLKIDTQGYEMDVLKGAVRSMNRIKLVQLETALVPNYSGEALIEDVISMMREHNFAPWWIIDGFKNKMTPQMFQVDVFFRNQDFE